MGHFNGTGNILVYKLLGWFMNVHFIITLTNTHML